MPWPKRYTRARHGRSFEIGRGWVDAVKDALLRQSRVHLYSRPTTYFNRKSTQGQPQFVFGGFINGTNNTQACLRSRSSRGSCSRSRTAHNEIPLRRRRRRHHSHTRSLDRRVGRQAVCIKFSVTLPGMKNNKDVRDMLPRTRVYM